MLLGGGQWPFCLKQISDGSNGPTFRAFQLRPRRRQPRDLAVVAPAPAPEPARPDIFADREELEDSARQAAMNLLARAAAHPPQPAEPFCALAPEEVAGVEYEQLTNEEKTLVSLLPELTTRGARGLTGKPTFIYKGGRSPQDKQVRMSKGYSSRAI